MDWQDRIIKGAANVAEPALKFLKNGAHAQQALPAQHRLGAAGGMFLGWFALDKMRDIIFGVNQLTEGEYEDVKREDVPLPLRFLHKTIDWNPHSDAPSEQWKKVAYQLFPAVGAGVGTVAGSMFAIARTGRTKSFNETIKKEKLNIFEADWLAQNVQARPLRVLTAITGAFSAASMVPMIYGAFLNLSFSAATGGRIFTGSFTKGNANPDRALKNLLKNLPEYLKDAVGRDGKINEEWAKGIVDRVLSPLFGKDLSTPEAQEQARKAIQEILEKSFKGHNGNNALNQEEVIKAVAGDINKLFGADLEKTLTTLKLDKNHPEIGNSIPFARWLNELMVKAGVVNEKYGVKHFAKRTGAFTDQIKAERQGGNASMVGVGV